MEHTSQGSQLTVDGCLCCDFHSSLLFIFLYCFCRYIGRRDMTEKGAEVFPSPHQTLYRASPAVIVLGVYAQRIEQHTHSCAPTYLELLASVDLG
jgi:hypothetical protein